MCIIRCKSLSILYSRLNNVIIKKEFHEKINYQYVVSVINYSIFINVYVNKKVFENEDNYKNNYFNKIQFLNINSRSTIFKQRMATKQTRNNQIKKFDASFYYIL